MTAQVVTRWTTLHTEGWGVTGGVEGVNKNPNTLVHVLTATLMACWIAQEDTEGENKKKKIQR